MIIESVIFLNKRTHKIRDAFKPDFFQNLGFGSNSGSEMNYSGNSRFLWTLYSTRPNSYNCSSRKIHTKYHMPIKCILFRKSTSIESNTQVNAIFASIFVASLIQVIKFHTLFIKDEEKSIKCLYLLTLISLGAKTILNFKCHIKLPCNVTLNSLVM